MKKRLVEELDSFKGIWNGGYYEGDPLKPMSKSTYGQLGFISVLHATYLQCIKPYVNKNTVSLEIGPGRGAWTKALLPSKQVYALDALPAEHNGFFEYLEHPENVKYFQVKDFMCEMLPDNYFDYMFSFGCLCHVSFEGISEYARNIYPKLKRNSNCFWMVADYDKYNDAYSKNLDALSMWKVVQPIGRRYVPFRWLFAYIMKREPVYYANPDENDDPRPGRWYNAGIKRTCSMLEDIGYQIVDPDVGTCLRDPIIHFVKP